MVWERVRGTVTISDRTRAENALAAAALTTRIAEHKRCVVRDRLTVYRRMFEVVTHRSRVAA